MPKTGACAVDGLPQAVAKQLARLIDDVVARRIHAVRAEGARVHDLLALDMRQLSVPECDAQRRHWRMLTGRLGLTDWQQQNLGALRDAYLHRLQQIYAERQALNAQAMALIMPKHPDAAAEATGGEQQQQAAGSSAAAGEAADLAGRLHCLSINGYMYARRGCAELPRVLDEIRVRGRQQ